MQEVQEKEAAHQDLADLVTARQPSTISRVSERLALLKNVFVRTRTPRQAGIADRPYRKESSELSSSKLTSSIFRWFRFLAGRKRCCSTRSIDTEL